MQLHHIAGNSYYLDGENCVGVYVFPDRNCLLADSGASESQAKKIADLLAKEGLKPAYIFNTHAHVDHCGGNEYLQNQYHCRIIASQMAAALIENPVFGPTMLFTAWPLRVLRSRALMPHPSRVERIVDPGPLRVENTEFQVYDLPGHSYGHAGLLTPDGVAFMGDSLMHEQMLRSYPFLYMVDITRQLETIDFIGSQNWPCLFLTHGGLVADLSLCLEENRSRIARIGDEILALLDPGRSLEEIVAAMADRYNLNLNSGQYYIVSATVSAFLSHLSEGKLVKNKTEEGIMKFFRAPVRQTDIRTVL